MTWGLAAATSLAILIGFSLGLLGSGGTIITLPVLVYVARIPVPEAVPMSLAVVGGTSLIGSVMQYRRGNLDVRVARLFAVTGMISAYGGAWFTHRVSPHLLLLLFAVMMLAVGMAMLRARGETECAGVYRPARCAAAGAIVGLLTGFLGVGGGFLIGPALILFAGLGARKATGTALAIIALNSLSGLGGQLRYVRFGWGPAFVFLGTATVGMAIGVASGGWLSERTIRKVFAWFIIVVALVLGVQNAIAWLRQSGHLTTATNLIEASVG